MTITDKDYLPLPPSPEAVRGEQLELFLVVVLTPGEVLGSWKGGQFEGFF